MDPLEYNNDAPTDLFLPVRSNVHKHISVVRKNRKNVIKSMLLHR